MSKNRSSDQLFDMSSDAYWKELLDRIRDVRNYEVVGGW
jgi:hypothetical protein